MLYNVHVYEVVRVKIAGVEADSPEAAAKIAADAYEPDHLFSRLQFEKPVEDVAYGEETSGYMVDDITDMNHPTYTYLGPDFLPEEVQSCATAHKKETPDG